MAKITIRRLISRSRLIDKQIDPLFAQRCVMGASCVHEHVGAFYAPCAREGKQILQMKPFTSVEKIRGHSNRANVAGCQPIGEEMPPDSMPIG
jgi:hypothetical protein